MPARGLSMGRGGPRRWGTLPPRRGGGGHRTLCSDAQISIARAKMCWDFCRGMGNGYVPTLKITYEPPQLYISILSIVDAGACVDACTDAIRQPIPRGVGCGYCPRQHGRDVIPQTYFFTVYAVVQNVLDMVTYSSAACVTWYVYIRSFLSLRGPSQGILYEVA